MSNICLNGATIGAPPEARNEGRRDVVRTTDDDRPRTKRLIGCRFLVDCFFVFLSFSALASAPAPMDGDDSMSWEDEEAEQGVFGEDETRSERPSWTVLEKADIEAAQSAAMSTLCG